MRFVVLQRQRQVITRMRTAVDIEAHPCVETPEVRRLSAMHQSAWAGCVSESRVGQQMGQAQGAGAWQLVPARTLQQAAPAQLLHQPAALQQATLAHCRQNCHQH